MPSAERGRIKRSNKRRLKGEEGGLATPWDTHTHTTWMCNRRANTYATEQLQLFSLFFLFSFSSLQVCVGVCGCVWLCFLSLISLWLCLLSKYCATRWRRPATVWRATHHCWWGNDKEKRIRKLICLTNWVSNVAQKFPIYILFVDIKTNQISKITHPLLKE